MFDREVLPKFTVETSIFPFTNNADFTSTLLTVLAGAKLPNPERDTWPEKVEDPRNLCRLEVLVAPHDKVFDLFIVEEGTP